MTPHAMTLIAILLLLFGGVCGWVLKWAADKLDSRRPTMLQRSVWRRLAKAGEECQFAFRQVDHFAKTGEDYQFRDAAKIAIRAQMYIERVVRDGYKADLSKNDYEVAENILELWVQSASASKLDHGMRLIRMMPTLDDGKWRWWTSPEYFEQLEQEEVTVS